MIGPIEREPFTTNPNIGISILRSGVLLSLMIGTVFGLLWQPEQLYEALASIRTSVWFPILLLLALCVRPLFLFPLAPLSVLIGFQYGIRFGIPFTLAGTVLTSLFPYYIAEKFRHSEGNIGKIAKRGERAMEDVSGIIGMTASRLSPVPADVVSYGAGLVGISSRNFVLGTVAGELPWAIVYVTVGASLSEYDFSRFKIHPSFLSGMFVLSGLVVVGYYFVQRYYCRAT